MYLIGDKTADETEQVTYGVVLVYSARLENEQCHKLVVSVVRLSLLYCKYSIVALCLELLLFMNVLARLYFQTSSGRSPVSPAAMPYAVEGGRSSDIFFFWQDEMMTACGFLRSKLRPLSAQLEHYLIIKILMMSAYFDRLPLPISSYHVWHESVPELSRPSGYASDHLVV